MTKLTFKQFILGEAKQQLIAYHVTKQDITNRPFLQASSNRTALNSSDAIVNKLVPWYATSVFFSIGWAAALEWEEYYGGCVELQYSVAYLLNNFSCILLKSDHMRERYLYLEYFIPTADKQEFLHLVDEHIKAAKYKIYKGRRPFIPVSAHPKMTEWYNYAKNATSSQLKSFIVNELLITNKSEIFNYLTHYPNGDCELLVQGKIPTSMAINIRKIG
ncbi:MAG: hypothetical protein ACXW2E_01980 [Nitrososphaeraceae archaeon]